MVVAVAKIRSPGPTTRKRRARLWLPLMAAGRTQKVSGRPQPQQPTSWKLAKYDDLPQIGKFLTVHGLLFDMGDGLHEFRHQSTARRAGRKRRIPYTTSQRPPPRRGQDCPHPPDHELAAVLLTANETVGEHRGRAFEPPILALDLEQHARETTPRILLGGKHSPEYSLTATEAILLSPPRAGLAAVLPAGPVRQPALASRVTTFA